MFQSLLWHLDRQHRANPERPALQFNASGTWESLTWAEYRGKVRNLALALLEMGIGPGDRVAIYASSRLEWALFDFALLSLQAVVVPVYPTVSIEDLETILKDSQPKFLVLENGLPARQFRIIQDQIDFIEKIITMDTVSSIKNTRKNWHYWRDLEAPIRVRPAEENRASEEQWEKLWKSIEPSTVATIVYTSGTSGTPKGVMLRHEQALSEVVDAFDGVGVTAEDVSLSFLPYSHILGRLEIWGHAYSGFLLCFARSIERVREDLQAIRPTIMVSVPRIFEKFYAALQTRIEGSFATRRIAAWALKVGYRIGTRKLKREPLDLALASGAWLADKVFLRRVKSLFGGRLRFAICGGAPMDPQMARFFHACGVLLLEGYGLTETTGAICVNTPYDYEFGTVGKPVGDVELRLAEDGEIEVHSRKVAAGYWGDEKSTAESFRDGWFSTGDIGEFTPSGHLKITDRKKDLIKTAGGKYVAPQKIEAMLAGNPLISHVLIHGDKRKYVVALITLNKDEAKKFAKDKNLQYQDFASLTQHPEILKIIRAVIAETNSKLGNHESIKKFSVLREDFSIEAGDLTPSLKLRRKHLDRKYRTQIDALYS